MELEVELKGLLSERKKGFLGRPHFVKKEVIESDATEQLISNEDNIVIDPTEKVPDLVEVGKLHSDGDAKGLTVDMDGKKDYINNENNTPTAAVGDEVDILSPEIFKENITRKRKRDPMLELLNWVTKIARNPCHPDAGSVPERSKWKSRGSGEFWRQVLSFKESAFLRRGFDLWQKNQKMHPSLYDDQIRGSVYNLRERLNSNEKLHSELVASKTHARSQSSSSVYQSDLEGSLRGVDKKLNKSYDSSPAHLVFKADPKVSIGLEHQAEVPEWTGVPQESELKWLGTQIWPLDKKEKTLLIERDPIGRGRLDSCGCQIRDSIGCVKFHIFEKNVKVKVELGSAFYHWKLDNIGEQVARGWKMEEEEMFSSIVKSNASSRDKYFWDQLFTRFPTRSREELVSYYFNVYLLRRRANQNRITPDNIDSDDESNCGLAKAFGRKRSS